MRMEDRGTKAGVVIGSSSFVHQMNTDGADNKARLFSIATEIEP